MCICFGEVKRKVVGTIAYLFLGCSPLLLPPLVYLRGLIGNEIRYVQLAHKLLGTSTIATCIVFKSMVRVCCSIVQLYLLDSVHIIILTVAVWYTYANTMVFGFIAYMLCCPHKQVYFLPNCAVSDDKLLLAAWQKIVQPP